MASFALQHMFPLVPPSYAQEHHLPRALLHPSVSCRSQRNAVGATRCGCGTPSSSRRRKALPFHSSAKGPYSPHVTLKAVSNAAVAPSSEPVSEMQAPEVSDQLDNQMDLTDEEKQSRIASACDKLIEVFMVDKPTPADWRKLLAFSRTWDKLRPHFFQRCQERANAELDPGKKHQVLRFQRKLKEIDDDVQRHNELLQVIKASTANIDEIVARRRKDFTSDFFIHLRAVTQSYYNDPTEQNALAMLVKTSMAAVHAYDNASESSEALNAAKLKFEDILNSPTLDVACRKIDTLAEKKELDSALMLMLTKAWASTKETSMEKTEAKDIMYHLYMTARGNLQRLMPKEVRIIKYLLTIEDPELLLSSLKDAFTPGEELEGETSDQLYTTPMKLFTLIRTVVDAYHLSKEGTVIREARDLMNPKIMKKMEDLLKLVQDKFM